VNGSGGDDFDSDKGEMARCVGMTVVGRYVEENYGEKL
jgi:hypothetical protein